MDEKYPQRTWKIPSYCIVSVILNVILLITLTILNTNHTLIINPFVKPAVEPIVEPIVEPTVAVSYDVPTTSIPKHTCKSKWFPYKNKCYYFNYSHKTWKDSNEWCIEQNSTLVILKDVDTMRNIVNFACDHWIGFTGNNKTKSFTWIDGTPLNTSMFWVEANNDIYDYGYLLWDGTTNDGLLKTTLNSKEKRFVCVN